MAFIFEMLPIYQKTVDFADHAGVRSGRPTTLSFLQSVFQRVAVVFHRQLVFALPLV
jgi:hypothetical protein